MIEKNHEIIPGSGPFYYEGSNIGLLLIHGGGGGTCADLKPLAEDLHKIKGFTINVPLLPGFGTSPKNLRNTPISSWKTAIEREINFLNNKCNRLIIGGHSMGGLLSLILAAQYNFDAVFMISTPAGIQRFLFKLVPFFKLFIKYHSIDSQTLRNDTNGAWVGYDKIPLNIATKAKKLMNEMKESLYKVKCPAILFQGYLDSEIRKDSMDFIYKNISSQIKRRIWLENSGHPILNSPDHQQIVSELINFISEICI